LKEARNSEKKLIKALLFMGVTISLGSIFLVDPPSDPSVIELTFYYGGRLLRVGGIFGGLFTSL
jgi:hypothetical protein